MKFIRKTNFKDKKEELEALYGFYLTQENENFELLEKSIEAQENCTRALWQKYEESCPEVDCQGVYGGVNNSHILSYILKVSGEFILEILSHVVALPPLIALRGVLR